MATLEDFLYRLAMTVTLKTDDRYERAWEHLDSFSLRDWVHVKNIAFVPLDG